MDDLYLLHLQYALTHANSALADAYALGGVTHTQRSYLGTRRDTVLALIKLHEMMVEHDNA